MNIVIITGIFPPDIGGPASSVPKIATELTRRGHAVQVICLSDSLDHDDSGYPFPVIRLRRGLFKPWRILKTIWTIRKAAKHSDLVYVNGLAFEAALAARSASVPMVHKVVGDYAWERAQSRGWFSGTLIEYQSHSKGLLLRLIDWVRTFPLQLADKIIVPSNYLKRIVIGWGINDQKIEVVYNAVEQFSGDAVTPMLPYSPLKTVMTICRLIPLKKVDGLIRVLPRLPDVRLVVAGDGPMRQELEYLAQQLRVTERVIFLGQVPKEHVSAYLQHSDCFVLNSIHEGLPHVVLEAMQAGVPVVATDVGGTGEVIEHGVSGLLIQPGDDIALRDALRRVLDNPSQAEAFRQTARKRLAAKFSYSQMIRRTEEVLISEARQRQRSSKV